MNRNAPLLLLLCLVLPWIAAPRGWADKVSQPGLFTYEAPPGWAVKSSPMSKYPVAMDAARNGFSATINVVTEPNAGSLQDYVAANKSALSGSPMFANLQFLDEKPFQTASGISGVRLVVTDTMGGKLNLRQIFYFFPGPNGTKFVVTATSLPDDGDRTAPLFDTALKSFTQP